MGSRGVERPTTEVNPFDVGCFRISIGAQSPTGGAVFVYSPPGTCAGDRTIPRRRPATAGVCNARRGLGGPRDQHPPRNRCGVRWLELRQSIRKRRYPVLYLTVGQSISRWININDCYQ